MAAKPLDIWRTPSSTHWQYPPKRSSALQAFYGYLLADRTVCSKNISGTVSIQEHKKDGNSGLRQNVSTDSVWITTQITATIPNSRRVELPLRWWLTGGLAVYLQSTLLSCAAAICHLPLRFNQVSVQTWHCFASGWVLSLPMACSLP
jgi:hypothetical protein